MNLFDVYPLYDILPVRGSGSYVFDDEGTAFLDLYGGHAVISVGHAHPDYVRAISRQVKKLGFYSNSVKNDLQEELAEKLGRLSGCLDYQLFLCNSGAEANENALKLASFHTSRKRVLYFRNAFHGRTSGAVAVTDNPKIQAKFNQQHEVGRLEFEDLATLEKELQQEDVAAVIFEVIQGVGGLSEASTGFYRELERLARRYGSLLIADEVQSGYGRTGNFFAYQHHGIRPDIVSVAKGMGNGFPIGGILIAPEIKPEAGLLGTTFGGNHLACAAGLAVLEILEKENLMENALKMSEHIRNRAADIPQIKRLKGRGLMLGLEFDFAVAALRKTLLFEHQVFTGASSNENLLRILPPLNIQAEPLDYFFEHLEQILK